MKEFSVKIDIDKDVNLEELIKEMGGESHCRISLKRDGKTKVIKSALLDETQIQPQSAPGAGDAVTAQDLAQAIYDSHDAAASSLKAYRESKLDIIREGRDKLLKEADIELEKHKDSDPKAIGSEAAWKAHRIALRDMTDAYKADMSLLDAVDLAELSYPAKPE